MADFRVDLPRAGTVAPRQSIAPDRAQQPEDCMYLNLLQNQINALTGALNRLETGTLLLSRLGRIVFRNAAATRMLRTLDRVRYRDDRLLLLDRSEASTLEASLSLVLERKLRDVDPAGSGAMLIARENRSPLRLHFSPLAEGGSQDEAAVFVLLVDPDVHSVLPERVLRSLYAMTTAEAHVAMHLARGHSLSETARAVGITRETARSQLKAIFQKTGVHRQSDLLHLIGMRG